MKVQQLCFVHSSIQQVQKNDVCSVVPARRSPTCSMTANVACSARGTFDTQEQRCAWHAKVSVLVMGCFDFFCVFCVGIYFILLIRFGPFLHNFVVQNNVSNREHQIRRKTRSHVRLQQRCQLHVQVIYYYKSHNRVTILCIDLARFAPESIRNSFNA